MNHVGLPLARTTSGSLELSEDARGLKVRAHLDREDPDVKQIEPKMRRGDLSEMSIGFRATEQEWSDDYTERTIRAVSLHRGDVSLVSMAANPASTAALRSAGTLEQRKALAERIGGRICGPGLRLYDAPGVSRGGSSWHGLELIRQSSVNIARARKAKAMLGVPREDPIARERRRKAMAIAGESETRSGYAAHELAQLGAKGQAFANPDGHWSFPTKTRDDLEKAIRAVGRSGAAHSAVRRYLIGRAKAMGLSRLIPNNWAPSGALRS